MSIILKKVKVVDRNSPHHLKEVDIHIKRGVIEKIGKNLKVKAAKVVDQKHTCVSPGWLDIGTQIGEPGFEQREDLQSITQVALSGGYTAIAPFPNTFPATDNKSQVLFLINSSMDLPIDIYPIGALSKGCEGKEMSELIDMENNGAVAFSDGDRSVQSAGLLMRCLQYAKATKSLIIDRANDNSLSLEGQVHEGMASLIMGMKGIPSLAEESFVQRNISLAQYADSRLMLHSVSSAEAIRRLKEDHNADISASVSAFHLCLSEEDVMNFDSQLKLNPPLRSSKDTKALLKAVKDGTIAVICSGHTPLEEEYKECSFEAAVPGALGLQTTFALLNSHVGDQLPIEKLIEGLCHNPRAILGVECPSIKEGEKCDMTVFNTALNWVFDQSGNHSKSINSPFFGEEFTGGVLATFSGAYQHWNISV